MTAPRTLDYDGPLSPPRHNGELVFETAWQSRLFGATMLLYEAGAFAWDEFRTQLMAAVSAQQRAAGEFRYWDCWLDAFTQLVHDKGLCTPPALATRIAELAARPAGHDH